MISSFQTQLTPLTSCSLACYKPHKAYHVANPTSTATAASPAPPAAPAAPDHKFAALANDPALRELLKDPEVREKLWAVFRGKAEAEKWRADGSSKQMEMLGKLRAEDEKIEDLVKGIVGKMGDAEEGSEGK